MPSDTQDGPVINGVVLRDGDRIRFRHGYEATVTGLRGDPLTGGARWWCMDTEGLGKDPMPYYCTPKGRLWNPLVGYEAGEWDIAEILPPAPSAPLFVATPPYPGLRAVLDNGETRIIDSASITLLPQGTCFYTLVFQGGTNIRLRYGPDGRPHDRDWPAVTALLDPVSKGKAE